MNQLDFKNVPRMQDNSLDNPLNIIKICYTKVGIDNDFQRISVLLFHFCILCVQCKYLCSNLSAEAILNFGPILFITIFCVTAGTSALIYEKEIKLINIDLLQYCLSLKNNKINFYKQIRRECIIMSCVILTSAAIICYGFASFSPLFSDNDLFLIGKSLNINKLSITTIFKKTIYALYFVTFPFLIFFGVSVGILLFYLTLHSKYQIKLLNYFIRELLINDKKLYSTLENHQTEIYERLVYLTDRHVQLSKLIRKGFSSIDILVIIFTFTGMLAILGLILNCLHNFMYSNTFSMFNSVLVAIASIIVIELYIESGQEIINSSETLFQELINCPWYNWEIKNRKTFLIFLLNANKPITLTGFITINRILLLHIFKASYQLAMVLFQFNN